MAETILGSAVDFLENFGFFDVILPFLLVFTVVFGILEKTKIFGTNPDGTPKKNLNSMVAFVMGFFVVAAKEIVASIQESMPLVVLILLAVLSFLILMGSFVSGKDEFDFFKLLESWKLPLAGIFFVSVALIFIHSFGWLIPIVEYLVGQGIAIFLMIVFILIIAGIIAYVVSGREETGGE